MIPKLSIGSTLTVKCINNKGYELEFDVGETYEAHIVQYGALGVIGKDNEPYIYPPKLFEFVKEGWDA